MKKKFHPYRSLQNPFELPVVNARPFGTKELTAPATPIDPKRAKMALIGTGVVLAAGAAYSYWQGGSIFGSGGQSTTTATALPSIKITLDKPAVNQGDTLNVTLILANVASIQNPTAILTIAFPDVAAQYVVGTAQFVQGVALQQISVSPDEPPGTYSMTAELHDDQNNTIAKSSLSLIVLSTNAGGAPVPIIGGGGANAGAGGGGSAGSGGQGPVVTQVPNAPVVTNNGFTVNGWRNFPQITWNNNDNNVKWNMVVMQQPSGSINGQTLPTFAPIIMHASSSWNVPLPNPNSSGSPSLVLLPEVSYQMYVYSAYGSSQPSSDPNNGVWSSPAEADFTMPPPSATDMFSAPNPSVGATGVSTTLPYVAWSYSNSAIFQFEVWFDTDPHFGTGNPHYKWFINGAQTSPHNSAPISSVLQLQTGTTYYWQVRPWTLTGDGSFGPVWSFTTTGNPAVGTPPPTGGGGSTQNPPTFSGSVQSSATTLDISKQIQLTVYANASTNTPGAFSYMRLNAGASYDANTVIGWNTVNGVIAAVGSQASSTFNVDLAALGISTMSPVPQYVVFEVDLLGQDQNQIVAGGNPGFTNYVSGLRTTVRLTASGQTAAPPPVGGAVFNGSLQVSANNIDMNAQPKLTVYGNAQSSVTGAFSYLKLWVGASADGSTVDDATLVAVGVPAAVSGNTAGATWDVDLAALGFTSLQPAPVALIFEADLLAADQHTIVASGNPNANPYVRGLRTTVRLKQATATQPGSGGAQTGAGLPLTVNDVLPAGAWWWGTPDQATVKSLPAQVSPNDPYVLAIAFHNPTNHDADYGIALYYNNNSVLTGAITVAAGGIMEGDQHIQMPSSPGNYTISIVVSMKTGTGNAASDWTQLPGSPLVLATTQVSVAGAAQKSVQSTQQQQSDVAQRQMQQIASLTNGDQNTLNQLMQIAQTAANAQVQQAATQQAAVVRAKIQQQNVVHVQGGGGAAGAVLGQDAQGKPLRVGQQVAADGAPLIGGIHLSNGSTSAPRPGGGFWWVGPGLPGTASYAGDQNPQAGASQLAGARVHEWVYRDYPSY